MKNLIKYYIDSCNYLKLAFNKYGLKLPKPLLIIISKKTYIYNIKLHFKKTINVDKYLGNGYSINFITNVVLSRNRTSDFIFVGNVPENLMLQIINKYAIHSPVDNRTILLAFDQSQHNKMINLVIKNEIDKESKLKSINTNMRENIAELIFCYYNHIDNPNTIKLIMSNNYISYERYVYRICDKSFIDHCIEFNDDQIIYGIVNIITKKYIDLTIFSNLYLLIMKSTILKKRAVFNNISYINDFNFTQHELFDILLEIHPSQFSRIKCTPMIASVMYNINKNNIRHIPKSVRTQKMCDDAILYNPENLLYCDTITPSVISYVIENGDKKLLQCCAEIQNLSEENKLKILQKDPSLISDLLNVLESDIWFIIKNQPTNIKYVAKNLQTLKMCNYVLANCDNSFPLIYCKHIPRKILWKHVKASIYNIRFYKYLTLSLVKHAYKKYGADILPHISISQINSDIIIYLYKLCGIKIFDVSKIQIILVPEVIINDMLMQSYDHINILESHVIKMTNNDFAKLCAAIFDKYGVDKFINTIIVRFKGTCYGKKMGYEYEAQHINALYSILNKHVKYIDLSKENMNNTNSMIYNSPIKYDLNLDIQVFEEKATKNFPELVTFCGINRIIWVFTCTRDKKINLNLSYMLRALKVDPGIMKKLEPYNPNLNDALECLDNLYNVGTF